MVVLHRLVILLAVITGLGAGLGRYGLEPLGYVASPSAWLRATDTLLLLAVALMLEQVVSTLRGRKAAPPPAA